MSLNMIFHVAYENAALLPHCKALCSEKSELFRLTMKVQSIKASVMCLNDNTDLIIQL